MELFTGKAFFLVASLIQILILVSDFLINSDL